MSLPLSWQQQNALHVRTVEAFAALRAAADRFGVCLNFDLLDLRQRIAGRLGSRGCEYCRGPLDVDTFAVTHRTPIIRGGKFTLRNLAVCCGGCRSAKDVLDDGEYRELLAVLQHWPRPVQQHLLARLRAGASTARAALPRPGGLEWFTGNACPGDPEHDVPDNSTAVGDPADARPDSARASQAAGAESRASGDSRGADVPPGQPRPVPLAQSVPGASQRGG